MGKAELNYNYVNDKIKLKGNSNVEYPIFVLKAEIEELKSVVIVTKTKYVVPGKVIGRSHDILNWKKTHPNNGKLYKEPNGNT